MVIKKILFPIDFSDRAVGAARYVEAFAGRFEAELMLLHVVNDGVRVLADEIEPFRNSELQQFLSEELKYFNPARVCVTGDPAAKIIEIARSWKPDLVMMPTHGVGLYNRLFLGSVTAKVLHELDCPLWTDIHAEKAPPLEKITIRKVLCAVDLEEQSGKVLGWADSLAREYSAELGIAHAAPAVEAAAPAHYLDEEYAAAIISQAKASLATLEASLGCKAANFIVSGQPSTVVSEVAKQFAADLLVIGRHGGAGVAAHLRQNANAILRESPCPVISI
ncbi:MAG TPA: universal stress protein [Bryobacteraceae bacterium]|nr:universal stress protein [Bryobacteraceae bacterium]